MQFTPPITNGYTVYSKTGCSYCKKAKNLFDELQLYYTVVSCDKYLLDSRDEFLDFIKTRAGKEYKTFPMVFHNGSFIGGYTDTLKYCDTNSD
jgi:glutaredoxin